MNARRVAPDEACGGYNWRKLVGLHRRTSLPNQLTARPPNREIKVRGLRSSRWCTRGEDVEAHIANEMREGYKES
jgi:hypothetical protein